MSPNFTRLIFIAWLVAASALFVQAQTDSATRSGISPKEDLPSGIKESLAKQRIDREKKDFAAMIERGEEILKLSDQLEKSYIQNNGFSVEDQKKLDRLEKVVKKIRNEMGGDDDENIESTPLSTSGALENLKINTAKLLEEVKKTSRYSISVAAVQSSNTLLRIVRFLRFRKN